MTKFFQQFVLAALALFTSAGIHAQEATPEHKDSIKQVVDAYYDMQLKIFQKNSTVEMIDELFNMYTQDFTYVHPKYGGTYTREDLYNGYTRNQKNGSYDGSVTDIKINNSIVGLNAAVLEWAYVKKEGSGKPQMTLFEFEKGKISRIFEYW